MGQVVIAAYRPKAGRESELLACVRDHLPVLRRSGLATDRPAVVLRAVDGTVIEIFEWISPSAIDRAHSNASVRDLWDRFAACSDYVPLADVPETRVIFSPFEPLDVQP